MDEVPLGGAMNEVYLRKNRKCWVFSREEMASNFPMSPCVFSF